VPGRKEIAPEEQIKHGAFLVKSFRRFPEDAGKSPEFGMALRLVFNIRS
jgi:hypothetical protein